MCKLCEEEGHLWAVVWYIHNNAVQAGLCDHRGHSWTSYHAYALGRWELVGGEEAAKLFGPVAGTRGAKCES